MGAGKDRFDLTTMERKGNSPGATIEDLNIDDDQIGLGAEDGEAFSRGLSWVQEDIVGSTLNPSWYFEGGRGNNKDDLPGIFLDFGGADPLVGTTGQLWYNPTSHIRGDSKWFVTVEAAGDAEIVGLSANDFVLI
jgi:hypothetical protein